MIVVPVLTEAEAVAAFELVSVAGADGTLDDAVEAVPGLASIATLYIAFDESSISTAAVVFDREPAIGTTEDDAPGTNTTTDDVSVNVDSDENEASITVIVLIVIGVLILTAVAACWHFRWFGLFG